MKLAYDLYQIRIQLNILKGFATLRSSVLSTISNALDMSLGQVSAQGSIAIFGAGCA